MKDTIFLTGITGNLGSWLAGEILRHGKHILALVRNKKNENVKKRLDSILDIIGIDSLRNNIELISGDICRKGLGIKPNLNKLTEISKVIHCAASTKFQEDNEKLSYMTNMEGTRNVLEFATHLSVPIVYVSTAYIAGKRRGIVKENEIDTGQDFNNIYEHTKCQAEKLVHSWAYQNSLPAVVLRPSIVMGDSRSGRTIRFNSMYDIIRVLDLVIPHLGDNEILIPGKAEATKNIIPVDYFAQVAWHIIDSDVDGTYHITNPSPLTIKNICDIFANLLNSYRYKLVDPSDLTFHKSNNIQRTIQKASLKYNTYMTFEPFFDRTNTDRVLTTSDIELPTVGLSYFGCLLNYARSVKWGKKRRVESKDTSNLQEKLDVTA